MRSRFTAFALGDADHLARTWHPSTAPARLDLEGAPQWDRLEIVRTLDGSVGDRRGMVEFRAHWRDATTGERGVLHETSRFRVAAGRWFYVDGDVDGDVDSDVAGYQGGTAPA